jgi:hypothetical protein
VSVVLFGAVAISAVGGLLESIGHAIASENVRATVAAGVAVVLYASGAIAWLIGIRFIAGWRGARWAFTIGLGAAIAIRLVLAVAVRSPIAGGGAASVNGDAAALHAEAVRAATTGLVPGDWAIGYPALLGALFAVAGEQRWLEAGLDVAGSALIGLIVFDLLRRSGGVGVAAAGIGLFAIMPSQALLVPAFGPDLAYATLMLGAIWLLLAAPRMPLRVRRWSMRPGPWAILCTAGAGLLLGASHLLRPTSLALLPAFVIVALITLRTSHPRRAAAALVVAFLVVLMPVVVDNVARHRTLSLEPTSHAGWRLWVGTDAGSEGGLADIDPDGLEAFPGETTRARSDAAGEEAWTRVLGAPTAFGDLAGTKFAEAWSDDAYAARLAIPTAGSSRGAGLLLAFEIASQLAWAFVALAAAWGVARSWPLSDTLLACVLVVASLVVVHLVIATEGRDHAVVVPIFLVAAAAGFAGPLKRSDPPAGGRTDASANASEARDVVP